MVKNENFQSADVVEPIEEKENKLFLSNLISKSRLLLFLALLTFAGAVEGCKKVEKGTINLMLPDDKLDKISDQFDPFLIKKILECYHSYGKAKEYKKGEYTKSREGSAFKAKQYITIYWEGTVLGGKYTTNVILEINYDPVRSTSDYQWRMRPVSDDSLVSPSGDECDLNEWHTGEF